MNRIALLKCLKSAGVRSALPFVMLFLAAGASGAQSLPPKPQAPPGTYLNPVGAPPIRLQEPFILPYANKYYLFGTAPHREGVQCYESPDLAHWKLDGWAWRRTGLHVARGDLHSPQVFLYQGMFCLVYSARMPSGIQLGLAAGVSPEGPYHDLHVPWLTLGQACVAGDVFVDRNGKAYLTYTEASRRNGCNYRAVYGVSLSKDLSTVIGQPTRLLEPSQRWELAQRDLNRCNEAARMVKFGSRYYLTYSANDPRSSDCAIGYAVADNPLGPWKKSVENPLLRTHSKIGVLGPGHGVIFRSIDRSESFIVYDSLADPADPHEDHVVNIDRLIVQDDSRLAVSGPTRSPQPMPSSAR